MSSKKRRPWRQSIDGQFAPRRIEMLESPAYRVLSLSARRVLDRLEIELARHGGNDNGKLPVTFNDFHDYGIHRHAIAPGVREVVALGFTTFQPGKAGNAEFRTPSRFGITYRHVDRAKPTDEWRRIQTIEEAEAIALEARRPVQRRRPKKQNSSAGKRHVSVTKTITENSKSPVPETITTAKVRKPSLLSIYGDGGTNTSGQDTAAAIATPAYAVVRPPKPGHPFALANGAMAAYSVERPRPVVTTHEPPPNPVRVAPPSSGLSDNERITRTEREQRARER